MKDFEERFWEKVNRGDAEACWDWTACLTPGGYGLFWDTGRRRMVPAHIVAYEIAVALVPNAPGRRGAQGVLVCHTCDNRRCCNPAHLFLGTQAENMADMRAKGRSPVNRAERNPKAKLSRIDVRAIRAAVTGRYGERSELARRYGISTGHVSKILSGVVWPDA